MGCQNQIFIIGILPYFQQGYLQSFLYLVYGNYHLELDWHQLFLQTFIHF